MKSSLFKLNFLRYLYTSPASASLPPLFNCSQVSSSDFMSSSLIIFVCTCTKHILCPFNIAYKYMSPGLTTWYWVGYVGTRSQRKVILPLSAAMDFLYLFIQEWQFLTLFLSTSRTLACWCQGDQIREVITEGGSEAWSILLNMDHIEANSILIGINNKNKRNGLNWSKEKTMDWVH